MSTPAKWRVIPKPIFQVIAILLLIGCFGLTFFSIWQGIRPFSLIFNWLGEDLWGLAAFLTFLTLFAGWALVVLPLRLFSKMPTYHEELAAAKAANFKELYQLQKQNMFLGEIDAHTPQQKAIRSRWLVIGSLLIFVISATAALFIYLIIDALWIFGILIAVISLPVAAWHLLKIVWYQKQSPD